MEKYRLSIMEPRSTPVAITFFLSLVTFLIYDAGPFKYAKPIIIEISANVKSIVNFCGEKKIVGSTKKDRRRNTPAAANEIKARV